MCAASALARAEQEKRKDGEERFLNSEGVSRPIPCSERSVQVKLARKLHESQRQKKNLDGLYEVLAPGSTVCKVGPTTSVIKEPHKQEVRVRNSDIAKIGTRAERDTNLAQRKINEQTIEHKIYKHKRDLIRKNTGDKKIKRNRRQSDDVSVVSSGRSCISSASNIARSLKMRIPKRNPKHDEAFLNLSDLTQILRFSPIAPQLTTSNTAGPSATQMTSSVQPIPTPILRKTKKRQITISDTSDSDTSSVRKSKRTLKKKTPKSQTIIEKVRNTEGYSDNANQGIGDARNANECAEDTQNQPREMTVLLAENAGKSDSEWIWIKQKLHKTFIFYLLCNTLLLSNRWIFINFLILITKFIFSQIGGNVIRQWILFIYPYPYLVHSFVVSSIWRANAISVQLLSTSSRF